MTTATPSFNPSCPNNSIDIFYACDYGSRFLGCCDTSSVSSVCNSGCNRQIPASFDGQYYSDITTNNCSFGSEWYVCAYTKPTFFGCCKSNACANDTGCPSNDTTSAILSMDGAAKTPWNPIVSETSASNADKYTTGTVLGSVFGGIFCGLILAFLFVETFYYFRRKAERSKESGSGKRAIDEVLEHQARVPVPMSLTESSAANVRPPSIPPISPPVSRLIVTNPTIELEEAPLPVSHDVNAIANTYPQANASAIGTRSSNSRPEPQQHPLPERVPQPQADFQGFFRGNRFTEAAGAQTRVLLEKVKRRSGSHA